MQIKATKAGEILAALDKHNVSSEVVAWCVKILGNRYADWWDRSNHRELIESKSKSSNANRARWKLVQLTKSDLDLRPESQVEIPRSLRETQFPP
jgi:hypothetical protein